MVIRTAAAMQARMPQAFAVFAQGRERGLHYGLQLWISLKGEILADAACGESTPGEALTPDHWLPWLSAGKPLTAVLIAQLWERGQLDLDDAVARFISEFATQGKDNITVRHLLTHTAGLRSIDTGWPDCAWEETISRICSAAPDADAISGETAGYHVASTWFLLAEIVSRVHQRPFADVARSELFEPCGMHDVCFRVSADQREYLGEKLAPLWERDKSGLKQLDWHRPPRIEHPSPGSSARGPVRELGRFYEMLRRGGMGPIGQLLKPETVAAMTSRQREGAFDQTLGHKVDFGLGLIIDSNRYGAATVPYGYGRSCSERTFGHGGAQSSQGYCDPERELVVAYIFNGRPGEPQHNRRCRAINDAIYADLGFAE